MLGKLFAASRPQAFKRACAVFAEPNTGHTIVAPYDNVDGMFVERPGACLVTNLGDFDRLGQAIRTALQTSRYVEPKLSRGPAKRKLADWPAFQASGVKTLKAFQTNYVPIVFRGLNEANLIYDAYGPAMGDHSLRLHVTVGSNDPDHTFGSAAALLVHETQRFLAGSRNRSTES